MKSPSSSVTFLANTLSLSNETDLARRQRVGGIYVVSSYEQKLIEQKKGG